MTITVRFDRVPALTEAERAELTTPRHSLKSEGSKELKNMSKEAAATRAMAKYFQSVGEGLAGIGEPDAAEWLRKAGTLKQRLKPQVITSDARKICRAFDAADERDALRKAEGREP